MKGIQIIGKGVTALADFCACMTLSHCGLHHTTFQDHLKTFVEACESSATASEAASVAVIKILYRCLDSFGNIDVIFDASWVIQGHSNYISVGCIMMSTLVL